MNCSYCLSRRGHQRDHLITKNQARRNLKAAAARDLAAYIVACCSFCNQAKGVLARVPKSHEHLIPELEYLTGSTYAVYDGTAKSLRAVVK